MSQSEPTLSDVHADLVGRLKQDERLRAVEQQVAALGTLPTELVRMEGRLTAAIEAAKPKPVWPAVAALTSVFGVVLVLMAAIYGQ